jgi:CheY-like chemotaxis protein
MKALESDTGTDRDSRVPTLVSRVLRSSTYCGRASLLIVQRNALTARSLQRYLGRHFAEVLVASSRKAAEEVLQTGRVTHLLCGDDLGGDEPRGGELVPEWRHSYPELERAILATAADRDEVDAPGIDGVFSKPGEPSALLELLAVHEFTRHPPLVSLQLIEEQGARYEKVIYQSA